MSYPSLFFSQIVLSFLDASDFHMNFRITLSVLQKTPARILTGITMNCKSFWEVLSSQQYCLPVHLFRSSLINNVLSFIVYFLHLLSSVLQSVLFFFGAIVDWIVFQFHFWIVQCLQKHNCFLCIDLVSCNVTKSFTLTVFCRFLRIF